MSDAVVCTDAVKTFGSVRAVDGVSFSVEEGEVFGLLGPNGAGKTTILRSLVTLLPFDSGSATVFGLDVAHEAMAVRRLIGYLPQQLSADGALSGRENVWLFARLFDVPRRERAQRIDEVLTTMGLQAAAERTASTYSGGMLRRLELAQALVPRPRLLVLDEPTIGLDPIARAGLWERVRALREETGVTILVTTHYMEEADELCDRIALMHHGRIRAVGTPAELKADIGQGATLDDVFRRFSGSVIDDEGSMRDVRSARRTARRLG
ncbi:MAG TPA: ATP-binding cassette domain-containing protein [Actinomycetota bacterium]|nr:ATP-binding cassette domain-containing protein [Actinomycetota bacterium]